MKLLEPLGRIAAIARKEVRQLRRDRLTFGMVVAIPILQLVLFGYAINEDVRHLGAGVVDLANTQSSRLFLADAQASQAIDLKHHADSPEMLEDWMRRGKIRVGVVIPPDFERRLEDRARLGRTARPLAQLLIDAGDPATYAAVAGLLDMPGPIRPGLQGPRWRYGASFSGSAPAPSFEPRPFYNPERRSAVHIVPGLVGVILTMTMVLFTSVAIVRERERGNLELLITTPMRPLELMVGKILPYVAIGLIQVGLVLGVGASIFSVPLRGTPFDTITAALVFITASLTLGLLISTIAKTQFQAFQLTVFAFLPQILMSGFMFPFEAMPTAAQWLGEVMPLTHFVRVIRGILLRGAGVWELRGDILPLVVFTVVTLLLAAARFRKRLD